jgi:AcrR family transcriptional regulator
VAADRPVAELQGPERVVSASVVSPRPSAKGTPRGDLKKAAIVEAAMTLFAREGYRGASLASIADSVQMTQPGLLHHFHSKEELLFAVLEERDRRSDDELERTLRPGGTSFYRSLQAVVERNAKSPEMVKLFTVLVGEAAVSTEHPGHEHFAARYRRVTARIRTELEGMQASGEIAADVDCGVVASMLVAMMDGLQVQWLLDPSVDMPAAFHAFSDLLANALVVPTSSHNGASVETVAKH